MLQVHITGTPAGERGGGEEAPPPQIIPTRVAPARRPAGERAGAGRDVAGEPPAAQPAAGPRELTPGSHDWNSRTSSAIQSWRPPALWCEPRAPEELPCPAFRSPRALAGPRPPPRARRRALRLLRRGRVHRSSSRPPRPPSAPILHDQFYDAWRVSLHGGLPLLLVGR